jgi:hypothetical protein
MTRLRYLILFLLLCNSAFALIEATSGLPASSFSLKDGDWYDNFGIDRNYYAGPDGFLPNLAPETLGENKEIAYSIGERFQENYQSKTERAVAILKYVQTWTEYGYDSDNVVRNGIAQEEWAWNADEMAHAFNQTTGVKAVGDCEDMAFLCGTIYVGAGFDAAIVDAPEHAALLIWLPEFSNADYYWDINDGKGAGWIWVEATGNSNPIGWTPPDFENGEWTAYHITNSSLFVTDPEPFQPTPIFDPIDYIPGFPLESIVIGLLLAIGIIYITKKKLSTSLPLSHKTLERAH